MMNKGLSLEKFIEIENSLSLLKEESISLSDENKEKFKGLYNDINKYSHNKEKGCKLEHLVLFIVNNTPIFQGIENIRTSTNEIDVLVRLSLVGNYMLSNGLIDLKSKEIIIECKNYENNKIDVTMVGKFCSLLMQSPSRVGLFISRKGFKGSKWDSAKGLAKKFYYYKERHDEKYFILDINLDEIYNSVLENSFVELIQSKIIGLENDTKYEHFITKHEAEDYFNN